MTLPNPTTIARRQYTTRLAVAIAVYLIVLMASIYWLTHGVPAGLRIPVAVLPAIPVLLIFVAGVRFVRATDEFERTTLLQSMAVAGAITAVASVTYGFLENAGFPALSAWWTWSVFMASWGIASIFVRRSLR